MRNARAAGAARAIVGATVAGTTVALLWILATSGLPLDGLAAIGNDDAMRLVQVREFIAGKGWFDLTQPRLGLDPGIEMHWSRLVDLPIAGLIIAFEPHLGQAGAEVMAMTLWPLALLMPALMGLAAAGERLGGLAGAIGAALIGAGALAASFKFAPGSLDHHNLQIALFALVLGGTLRAGGSRLWAGVAGAAVALSLAIGAEAAPLMALACLVFALLWAVDGAARRAPTRAFSMALAATLATTFVATATASAWRGGYCDALSLDLALPALVGALGLGGLASVASRSAAARWMGLLALAGIVAGIVILILPACLSNPLDRLDPRLEALWLSNVLEAQPLLTVIAERPEIFLGPAVGALLAMGVALAMALGGPEGRAALIAAAFTGLALALTAYQVRGLPFMTVAAALPLGAAAAGLYMRSRRSGRLGPGLAGIALFALALPFTWSAGVQAVGPFLRSAAVHAPGTAPGAADGAPAGGRTAPGPAPATAATTATGCLAPNAFDTLAALPPGRVSASSNLGAHILRHTAHSVLSAPYHRKQAGMLAQIEIAFAEDAAARERLSALDVDYVVSCALDPEYRTASAEEAPGFLFRLWHGVTPDFLEPVAEAGGSPLRVYRVRP